MKHILTCRRSSIAVISIAILGFLGYTKNMDVAMAISSVAIGLAGANAYEKKIQTGETKDAQ